MVSNAGFGEARLCSHKETYIAGFALVAILLNVVLKYALHFPFLICTLPLFAALLLGGIPMIWQLIKKLAKRQLY